MNSNTFTGYLGVDFQLKLFWQILTEHEFGNKIFPTLEVSYFDDNTHKQYFIVLKNYYNENERVPNLTNKSIYQAIENGDSNFDKFTKEILYEITNKIVLWNESVLNGKTPFDGDVIQKNAFQFIKQQEYRKLASFIVDKTKEGTIRTNDKVINDVEEKIKHISEIGVEDDDGESVSEGIEDALSDDYRQTIPTGIKALDEIMGGGLGRSEIGIILAGPGTGKTTFLTKIANTAFTNGHKVLQIIFEDKPKDIKRKHFAIWSGVSLSDINNNKDFVKESVINETKKIQEKGGVLTIKKFVQDETNIIDIKNWILRTQKKLGIKYELIVLDYLDCLESHKSGLTPHDAEFAIVKSFESMASELDIPMWSGLQGNRSGISVDFIGTEHMGGNIKRAQKTHFLMSVAKSPQQKESGTANIQILKARFASDGQQFKDCIYNNNTMEIRVTDTNYRTGTTMKKYGEDDLKKLDNHNIKLHSEISNSENNNTTSNLDKLREQYMKMKEDTNNGLDTNDDENLKNFLDQKSKDQGNIENNNKKE